MPHFRFRFLLQQPSRELYQLFGSKIRQAALAWRTAEIEAVIEFVEHLEPENIAARLSAHGQVCDATAVIAADHPLISQSIQALRRRGKPVVAYITDQSSPDRAGYVGTDN
jgi:LacI family transcriptional regulator